MPSPHKTLGISKLEENSLREVFETFAGELENAPMIKACRLTAECRLIKTVEFLAQIVTLDEQNVEGKEDQLAYFVLR